MTTLAVRGFRFAPVLTATVLTILGLWLLGAAAELFLLLFIAIIFALYLGSLTDFFVARAAMPRELAFLAALLLTVAALVAMFWVLIPPVIQQTQQLLRVLPDYLAQWEAGLERALERIPGVRDMFPPGEHAILGAVIEEIAGYFQDVGAKVYSVLHGAILLFAVTVMGIYLALHPGLYREWLIALFPPVHRDLIRDVLGDLGRTLRSWIVGQILAMVLLAVLTAIGLYLLRVPYWLTFGIFTGLVAIVPFFGTLVSTVLPALFVLSGTGIGAFGPVAHALLVILLGVVIHALEANIVAPKIMQHQLDLPPVLTIMAVLVLGKLLGPMGLIVAVPLLAVALVIVRRILINRIYEGQGFRRTPRDRVLVLRVPAPQGGVLVPAKPPLDVIALAEEEGGRRIA